MLLPNGFPGEIIYPSSISRQDLELLHPDDSVTSIRLHPHKAQHLEMHDKVPWHPHGRYLADRPMFAQDPDWHAGSYYVQDASSMLLLPALEACEISPEDQPTVLDLCAAPGGKSSLIAEWLDGRGILVCNEVIQSRSVTLAQNMTRSGYTNVMVCQMDPSALGKASDTFDIIVVDAPCSGEGLWRKTPASIEEWSTDHVHHCAARQQRILDDILPALKPGGYIIYATCTYNKEENTDQVDRLVTDHKLQPCAISCKHDSIEIVQGQYSSGIQAVAGRTRGEGQFMALARKPGTRDSNRRTTGGHALTRKQKTLVSDFVYEKYVNTPSIITKSGILYLLSPQIYSLYERLVSLGKILRTGLLVGKLSDRLLIPSHELAQSLAVNHDVFAVELGLEEALQYLRRQPQALADSALGWTLMKYNGNGLGWAKNLGKRINNYLPKGLVLKG